MNSILIIGAGRSATACIKYVLEKARERNWFVTVADADPQLADAKVAGHPNGRATWLDVLKVNDRRELIGRADVVVSLLPAHLHLEVAHDCIKLKKHLITASYVSQEMYRLGDEARDRELIFMGEMGLDPGIDHMSAMRTIQQIKDKGGNITAFRSFTGGLIAPDEKAIEYVRGREFAPEGAAFEEAAAYWKTLYSDEDAHFDQEYFFRAEDIEPMVTYGTNPGMGMGISQSIPEPPATGNSNTFLKSLNYMGLKPGQKLEGQPVNYVFIGSCTNSRIEDLRIAAAFVKGKQKADNVNVMVVPGSKQVEKQAREEGLDQVFREAGFDFREPGCSACLGMNEDKVPNGEYCVSTSNRNFEGRQGPGARTILASPLMAAATAIAGKIVDVREVLDV